MVDKQLSGIKRNVTNPSRLAEMLWPEALRTRPSEAGPQEAKNSLNMKIIEGPGADKRNKYKSKEQRHEGGGGGRRKVEGLKHKTELAPPCCFCRGS